MIDDILGDEQQTVRSKPMLQDYKKLKHGKEVPQEAEIQYLKHHLLAQALVDHKHVIHMTHDLFISSCVSRKRRAVDDDEEIVNDM